MNIKSVLSGLLAASALSSFAGLSDLQGEYRNGQVFLQWKESEMPADARLSVWSSAEPIKNGDLSKAVKVAGLLNIRSARDWWRDTESFVIKRSKKAKGEEIFAGKVADVGAKKISDAGFVITDNGQPISPDGGLHVHTPKAGQTGKRFFAVAMHNGTDEKVLEVISTAKAIEVGKGKANVITMSSNKVTRAMAQGRPMMIYLHGRGGGVGVDHRGNVVGTHIIFADSTLAWREGIPFKFTVEYVKLKSAGGIKNDYIRVTLCDRTWTGRRLTKAESPDSRDYVPAIASFWLGYNSNIGVSNCGPEFKWDNYSERLAVHIVRWLQENLGIDKNRIYLYGGSMGGSGTVHLATHFPEIWAAGWAKVPVYAYTWKKTAGFPNLSPSIYRMQCSIGRFRETDKVLMPDGTDILEFGDGARNINRPAVDMPPLFASNGRKDMSIPWVNNPPFFSAANEARQAFCVYWNNGGHSMDREAPRYISVTELFRYRLNQAYPAFSNSSDNRNYGNGDPADGDLEGWINRGMTWQGEIVDTADRFEMNLTANYPGIKYPVTSDVTFRRRQNFKFAPGTVIKVDINGKKSETVIDKNGLLTVEKVTFNDASPVKVICTVK